MTWIIEKFKYDKTMECPDCDGWGYSDWQQTNSPMHHGFKFYDCENCEGVGTIVKETK